MSSYLIAAADARQKTKDAADLACMGMGDQLEIAHLVATKSSSRIELSEGTFSINGPIGGSQLRKLTGQGRGVTILKRAPGYSGGIIDFMNNPGPLEVSGLTIDDQHIGSEPAVATMAVRFFECNDVAAFDLEIKNTLGIGLAVSSCQGAYVDRVWVSDAKGGPLGVGPRANCGHGILVNNGAGSKRSSGVVVSNCTLRRNWRTGIYITGSDGVRVVDNTCENNNPKEAVDAGIESGGQIGVSYGAEHVVISRNSVSGGRDSQGIELDVVDIGATTAAPARYITISDNVVWNQGRAGILIYVDPIVAAEKGAAFVAISHNVIRNCSLRGIKNYGAITVFPGVTDFTIHGNTVQEIKNPALLLMGKNARYVVGDNELATISAAIGNAAAAYEDRNQIGAGKVSNNALVVNGKLT